jgi:hypothetical protein
MAIDAVRSQLEGTQKQDVTQCEHTPITTFTKTRVHYSLVPRALFIGVILAGSLLTLLLFPILLSSGAPAILTTKSSSSRVELGHPFTMTGALTPNNMALSGSDLKVQRSTSSQTPIAATMNDVDGAQNYATFGRFNGRFNGVYSCKAVYKGDNFFNQSMSNVETIAVGNVLIPVTHLSVKMQGTRNVTGLDISISQQLVHPGDSFEITGRLYRIAPVITDGQQQVGVGFQPINLYGLDNSNPSSITLIKSTVTNIDGYYTFNVPVNREEKAGIYTYFTSFDGSSTDLSSTSLGVTVSILS